LMKMGCLRRIRRLLRDIDETWFSRLLE
jgi:hypothetical protein